MLRGKVEAIILDVDGTLSEDISWFRLTEGLGASREKHIELFREFTAGKLSYPKAKAGLLTIWRNTGKANKSFMEKMFRAWKLKPDAKDTVEYLGKNYRLCLISGAVELYVEVVADKLGVVDWYANTKLVWDGQGNLVDFHYDDDQSAKKVEHLNEYIARKGLDKTKCAIVGDGDSDLDLFKVLNYGIAVNKSPHNELEKLAYKKIENLKELKEIF